MKTTTLMVSTLIAGAIAGAAPQIPTFIKRAFAPGSIATSGAVDQRGSGGLQTAWPSSLKPVVLRRQGNNHVAYLPLHNPSTQTLCVRVDAHVQWFEGTDAQAMVVAPDRPFPVAPSTAIIKRVELTLKTANPKPLSGPATGFFRVSSAEVAGPADQGACSFSGTPKSSDLEIRIPEQPLMTWIFVGTLCVAVVVVIITAFSLPKDKGLFHVMGSVNWTFERSWGANVTLGGALLITLLGLTMFPDRPQLMTKASYSLLQVLFGAIVSLAPLVYNMIHREVQVNVSGIPRVEVQGYVITFLIAGGLVLWAAMGQVVTLSVVAEELISGGALEQSVGRTLQGLAAVLFLLLLVYGFRSLYLTAKTVSAAPAAIGGGMPGPQPAAAAGLPNPMTEWSVL